MLRVGYLFERFPSFGQTFCYREIAELQRQGAELAIFSIRRPTDEPAQDWDANVVSRVTYLPEEAALVQEIARDISRGALPEKAVQALKQWGRKTDFLRLYQACHVGQLLRSAGIQRVHAHFAGMAARTAYWIKQFFGIDYSLTVHANDIFAPREFEISLTSLFDAATAIVTVSDFAVEELKKRFPQNARKMHRVYNGIEVERFRVAQFASEIPLVISIGRLIEKKGFADLVAACAELKKRGVHFRCEIIGEGPLQAELTAQIRAAELEQHVRLLGPRSQHEIIERLAAANVFVLACTTEADGGMDNLPTVIMEAMAAGLPVISTSLAGVPEMVSPGETGELIPQRDPLALATAIARLLSDVPAARELGRVARARAAEKFAIATNVRALAAILKSNA